MNVIVRTQSKFKCPDDDDDDDIDIKRCGDAAGETTTSKRSQQVKYFCWKLVGDIKPKSRLIFSLFACFAETNRYHEVSSRYFDHFGIVLC